MTIFSPLDIVAMIVGYGVLVVSCCFVAFYVCVMALDVALFVSSKLRGT